MLACIPPDQVEGFHHRVIEPLVPDREGNAHQECDENKNKGFDL
jgi:hypothetical protein